MRKNIISIVYLIVGLLIIFITIGYSTLSTQFGINNIITHVRPQIDIRISALSVESVTNGGISNYEEFDHDTIFLGVNLPESTSSAKYKVSVTNIESEEMGIFDISGIPDGLEYQLDGYTLGEKLCDTSGKCSLGITKDFYITIKYKNGSYNSSLTNYSFSLDFDFRQMYTVTYEGVDDTNYPTSVIKNGQLEVTFSSEIPDTVSVFVNGVELSSSQFTYSSGLLQVPNVTGDVTIKATMVPKVAKIQTTYYPTLQDAINACPNNTQTQVDLLVDVSENLSIPSNKNIILNLGDNTVSKSTNAQIINLSGTLKIKDGEINGLNYSDFVEAIKVNSNATLTLSNVDVTRSASGNYKWETIMVEGTLNVESGNINSVDNTSITVYENTVLNVKGTANVTSASSVAIYNAAGTVNVSSGTVSSPTYFTIFNESTTNITGGTVSSTSNTAIKNYNTMTISSSAKITGGASEAPTIINHEGASLTINGGTISANYRAITNEVDTTLNITSGTISSKYEAVIANWGDTQISGSAQLKTTQSDYPTLNNQAGATCTISGGTVTSPTTNSVSNYGTMEITGSANVTNTATNSSPTLYNQTDAILTVSGGTLSSSASTTLANDTNAATFITGGTITTVSEAAIYNVGTVIVSGSPQITATQSYNATILNYTGGTFTLGGGTVESQLCNAIDNYAEFTISGDETNINAYSESYPTIYNQSDGSLIIKGGNINTDYSNAINNNGYMEILEYALISSETSTYPLVYNQPYSMLYMAQGEIRTTNGVGMVVDSNAQAIVAGGYGVVSENSTAVNNFGYFALDGGAMIATQSNYNVALYNNSGATAEIYNGMIEGADSNAVNNLGTLLITGEAFICNYSQNYPTVFMHAGSTTNIEGGHAGNYSGGYSYYNNGGTVNYTSGTYTEPYLL